MITLVDSCVLLDIFTQDPRWFAWSAEKLAHSYAGGQVAINPIIYSEVSVHFSRIEELDEALPEGEFRRLPLPWTAGFLAGKCFEKYRHQGGSRRSPLPDFYIGAHAVIEGMVLLTRDPSRYRAHFPALKIVSPSGRDIG